MNKTEVREELKNFFRKFGNPENSESCSEKIVDKYISKLPKQLFEYWRELGWSSYYNGLTWMVNPDEYKVILEKWLEGSAFEDRDDLSVISRTAFGELYIWAKGKGQVLEINPNLNIVFYYSENDKNNFSEEEENEKIRRFWSLKKIDNEDYEDKNENLLFKRALKKFGALKKDEQYGYKFSPKLGGNELIDNMEIMRVDIYHSIASQLEIPEIIIIDV